MRSFAVNELVNAVELYELPAGAKVESTGDQLFRVIELPEVDEVEQLASLLMDVCAPEDGIRRYMGAETSKRFEQVARYVLDNFERKTGENEQVSDEQLAPPFSLPPSSFKDRDGDTWVHEYDGRYRMSSWTLWDDAELRTAFYVNDQWGPLRNLVA